MDNTSYIMLCQHLTEINPKYKSSVYKLPRCFIFFLHPDTKTIQFLATVSFVLLLRFLIKIKIH